MSASGCWTLQDNHNKNEREVGALDGGQIGIVDCTARELSRKLAAEWIIKVYMTVLLQISRNGFERC